MRQQKRNNKLMQFVAVNELLMGLGQDT
jgi:hypothetical protein